eukprot:326417-Chlamydomonas_euryale.AAC.2
MNIASAVPWLSRKLNWAIGIERVPRGEKGGHTCCMHALEMRQRRDCPRSSGCRCRPLAVIKGGATSAHFQSSGVEAVLQLARAAPNERRKPLPHQLA